MNRIIPLVGVFILTTFPGLQALADGSGDASREDRVAAIHQLLAHSVEAWNAGDIEGFMETYHRGPELRFASGGTVHRGWQATLERYRRRYGSDAESMGRLAFEDIEMTHLAPDAVLVFGRYCLQRQGAESTGLFTLTVRHLAAGWRITQDHTSAE